MPRERQTVQVPEQFNLDLPRSVLVHADPEVRSQVVQHSHRASSTTLQELEEHVEQDPVPAESGGIGKTVHDLLAINRHVQINDTTRDQQGNR